MTPGNPNILKCPHCNGLMCISSIMSGNTFGMVQWSDAKREIPMLPKVSPVLKCPVCKQYFFYNHEQIVGHCNSWRVNSYWGHLSYSSLKEALEQLQPSGDEEIRIRVMLLQGYNDYYGGCLGTKQPTDASAEERTFFENNARRIIELIPDNKILCAEIYRELGEFEKSTTLLNSIPIDEYPTEIVEQIKERAMRHDSNVFILNGKTGERERTAEVDNEMYVYNEAEDEKDKRVSASNDYWNDYI